MSDQTLITDPADEVVRQFVRAMREAFSADSEFPPVGGGSDVVRFFGGDGIPLAAWNAHSADTDCSGPFLWVRLTRRYRSEQFPAPTTTGKNCAAPRVLAIEIGVGRCAVVDMEPTWEQYDLEAQISVDDSWRLELALCRAATFLTNSNVSPSVATDSIVPYGPEGGVIAWLASAYVQI